MPSAAQTVKVDILRKSGIGVDDNYSSVHTQIPATIIEKNRLIRTTEGVVGVKETVFLLDPKDYAAGGGAVDVKIGDRLQYTDWQGAQDTREVTDVNPQIVLQSLIEIVVKVR